ncbi:MAG: DUF4270 family protein [Chloroflexota bacterium]
MISCEEDPTIIGKELLPASDSVSIQSIDTLTPVSFTMYDDSVSTDNPSTSYLGQTFDPYFGTTSASFVSQIRLKEEWNGKAYTVDSIKLMLQFTDVKGGSGGTNTLTISEIAKDLSTTENYYSNTPVPLADFTMDIPLPALRQDTINEVEIKLTDLSFAQRILSDTTKLFHSNKTADFRSYFKGLYFKLSSTGDPMMLSVNLANNNSGYYIIDRYYKNFFVIYMHDNAGATKEFFLILDAINKNAAFNLYQHDFTTANGGMKITHYNDPSSRDTLTYQQSLNGVYTRIVFPGLEALKKSGNFSGIAVNKARLTVPFFSDEGLYKDKDVPKFLFLRYRTVKGTKPVVPDFNVDESHAFYDGLVDTTKHVYNFNLATFFQIYLDDKTGDILPELELVQGTGTKNIILKANSSSTPVKFDFTYTRF